MKYYRNFLVNWRFMLQIWWAAPLNFPVLWQWSLTFSSSMSFPYPTRATWLKLLLFFSHNQIFVKIFFHYFFTVFILFKNCFNKFISSIFTSLKSNAKSIINTNKFVSKTTRNVILILFWVKTFITFNTF